MRPRCPCAALPDETMHTGVCDVPELAACVDPIGVEQGLAVYFRCRICGTHWEENWASAMHASVQLLLRSKLDAHGKPVVQTIDLATRRRDT